ILYKEELELQGNLEIIPCEGYTRKLWHDQTTVPWVMPSPNMPSLETAIVYPGQCLLEGTNLSEGRGTTRPFELFGAPWLDADQTANTLNALGLPGVQFRPVNFRPNFQKWQGQICGGAQLHVYDRELYRPVRSSLAILQQLRNQDPSRFAWRTETYEFVSDRLAIDLLFGSDRERLALEQHIPWHEITREWEEEENDFLAMRQPYLIYGD
ncbi:MAG: exo-beta-N-acetylmuramidase NamZ domain-containing protein, partial [Gemmataceae bacterium]